MSADKEKAQRLAAALRRDQQGIALGAEGMGWSPSDQVREQAAALLDRWPDGDPVAWQLSNARVALSNPSSTMAAVYEQDGFLVALKVPYGPPFYSRTALIEAIDGAITKLLSPAPPAESERIAALEAERVALRIALEFALRAVEDAIYTEDGIDGQDGERLLHIFREALEKGTFDKVRYGDLPPMLLEVRNKALEAALKVAGEALEHLNNVYAGDSELVIAALRAIEEVQHG